MAAAGPQTNRRSARLAGVDIARAIALVGMLMVHFGPQGDDGLAQVLYSFPHGRASLLFIVVAGMGAALLTRRPDGRALARLRLVWFALMSLPLGLALQTLDHRVAVILHHYAFYFLFAALICGLSRRALLVIAVIAIFIGPALYLAGRIEAFPLFGRRSVAFGDPPLEIVQGLLTAGPYPLLTWAGPIAFGMFLGRLDLHSATVRWVMVTAGIGVALLTAPVSALAYEIFGAPAGRADWQTFFSAAPHSQMPLWLVNSGAVATAVIGIALVAGDRMGRLAIPLVVLGQFALSAYVAHVLLLTGWSELVQAQTPGKAMVSVIFYTGAATLAALLWRGLISRRGPLEWALHAPWNYLQSLAWTSKLAVGAPDKTRV